MVDILSLDPKTTALILIDLQNGIVARPSQPYSGADVVKNAVRLADAFRKKSALVVLVHVEYRTMQERLNLHIDAAPVSAANPPGWSDIVPELMPQPDDVVITKRQWGAFYGTDLDLQLRRRGIKTLILGGIATNFGVESTARYANERSFEQVFVEDAMSSISESAHRFTVETIFPRLGRVRSTNDVLEALK